MATADEYAAWIVKNADKKGTPEFETVAAAYRDAKSKGFGNAGLGKQSRPGAVRPAQESTAEQTPYEQVANEQSGLQNFVAGMGGAMKAPYVGVKQMVGATEPGEVESYKAAVRGLNSTPSGMAGNIAGNVAISAPLAAVPGANTIGGGALLGAATGAVQPVEEGESRGMNALMGAGAGMAIPAGMRALKTARAVAVDPFTQAGRDRIAGGVLNRTSADPAAAISRLQSAQGATPGFTPSVGQAADDAGLASLERTVRAIDPKAWDQMDTGQRAALADAVRSLAGNPIARKAAVDNRQNAVQALYDAAKKRVVLGDDELAAILQRPTVASGMSKAEKIAQDEGRKFALSNGSPARQVNTGVLDANGNQIVNTVPATPPTYLGQGLHDLKLGIDDAISEGSPGFGNRVTGSQLSAKDAYLNWLETHIPEYGQAKNTYAKLSQPINQMDIGQNFVERFIPALYRDMPAPAQLNSAGLARAVIDQGDDIARNVTGMSGARLDKVLTPEQLATLKGVISDSQMVKAAENAGRGVGSDTVQKLAMSNIAQEAGIPTWLANLGQVPGGWMKRAGDVLYGSADNQVRERLAQILQDPQLAARVMQSAGNNPTPSKLANALKMLGQTSAFAATPALTAQ